LSELNRVLEVGVAQRLVRVPAPWTAWQAVARQVAAEPPTPFEALRPSKTLRGLRDDQAARYVGLAAPALADESPEGVADRRGP
jgi:hypothetical protein